MSIEKVYPKPSTRTAVPAQTGITTAPPAANRLTGVPVSQYTEGADSGRVRRRRRSALGVRRAVRLGQEAAVAAGRDEAGRHGGVGAVLPPRTPLCPQPLSPDHATASHHRRIWQRRR